MDPVAGPTPSGLSELIARAGQRALVVSAVATLDRSLPALAAAIRIELDRAGILGPVREALENDGDWAQALQAARTRIADTVDSADDFDEESLGGARFGLAEVVNEMARHIPAEFSGEAVREWAVGCAYSAIDVRQALDAMLEEEPGPVEFIRAGQPLDITPLQGAEERRQIEILTALENQDGVARALRISDHGIPETTEALASAFPDSRA